MPRPLRLAAVLAALSLAACAGGAPDGDPEPGPDTPAAAPAPEPGTPPGAADEIPPTTAAVLRERQRQWEGAGIADYTFELERHCFCTPETTRPAVVRVEGGRVVSATDVETGAARDGEFPTIAEILARAIEAADGGESVAAEFDATLGHPTRVMIGSLAADAGIGYDVRNVRRVE